MSNHARRIARAISSQSSKGVPLGKTKLGIVTSVAPLRIMPMGGSIALPEDALIWTNLALITRDEWAVDDTVLLSMVNDQIYVVHDVIDTGSLIPVGEGGGGGVTDHGDLDGLADDDHPQYALADGTRGDFAATAHTHAIADTTGLQAALDAKAAASHVHAPGDITGHGDPAFHKVLTSQSGAAGAWNFITNSHISSGAEIAVSKLADGAAYEVVRTDAAGTGVEWSKITNDSIDAAAAIALSKLATDPLARANHTGTQLASTVSDFDTQVRTSKIHQLATPTAATPMNGQKFTGAGDASATGEFLTYDQALKAAGGLTMSSGTLWFNTGATLRLSGTWMTSRTAYSAGATVSNAPFRKVYTGTGGHTLTLTAATGSAAMLFENRGTGNVTIARATTDTITLNGTSALTSFTLQPGQAAWLFADGTSLWEGYTFGIVVAGQYAAGSIVNADISASASIALSKLATDPLARANHTGTQLAATISDFNTAASGASAAGAATVGGDLTGTVANAQIAAGAIVNADVGAAAAIAYSKLDLAGSIVNADIAAGAGIALSKLAQSGASATDVIAWNGTAWAPSPAGTPAAHAASHKASGTDEIKLHELGLPTAATPMNGQKFTGLAAGTGAGDSLRYEQVVGVYLLLAGGTLTGKLTTKTGTDAIEFGGDSTVQLGRSAAGTLQTNAHLEAVASVTAARLAAGSTGLRTGVSGEANYRAQLNPGTSGGELLMGAGGASALDWALRWSAAGIARLDSGDYIRAQSDPSNAEDLTRKSYVDAAAKTHAATPVQHTTTTASGVLASAASSANIVGITVTGDNTRAVEVECTIPSSRQTAGTVGRYDLVLHDGTANVASSVLTARAANVYNGSAVLRAIIPAFAGSKTFSLRITNQTGAGSFNGEVVGAATSPIVLTAKWVAV